MSPSASPGSVWTRPSSAESRAIVSARPLARSLVREGVDDRFLVRTDRLSTISMVATDDNGQPSYAFHGERGGSLVRAHQSAAELPPDVQALTFGSYTMAVEPVGSAFDTLAERECGRRVTSVDPNLRRPWSATWSAGRRRPSASTGPRPSSRPATRMCAPPGAAACRSRKPPSIGSIAARVGGGDRGSEKGDGVLRHRQVSVSAHSVAVRDTIGASDTFHAALLAQLAKTDRLSLEAIAELDLPAIRDLLGYAVAAAAVTVSRNGADLPTAAHVEASLAATVRLTEISEIDLKKGPDDQPRWSSRFRFEWCKFGAPVLERAIDAECRSPPQGEPITMTRYGARHLEIAETSERALSFAKKPRVST
jgi:fructokinase